MMKQYYDAATAPHIFHNFMKYVGLPPWQQAFPPMVCIM